MSLINVGQLKDLQFFEIEICDIRIRGAENIFICSY